MDTRSIETNSEHAQAYANYVPEFPDSVAVEKVIEELRGIDGVTNPNAIRLLRREFHELVLGERTEPIVISGNCSRRISADEPISKIVSEIAAQREIAEEVFGENVTFISRDPGQNFKPRSSAVEHSRDGEAYPSYFGDGINGMNFDQRTPDPSRMVAAALQARDIQQNMTGDPIRTAHEALVPAYERCFVIHEGQKAYLLSADLPWLGSRTKNINGPQVEFLSKIENPIGIKIDAQVKPEEIRELYQTLNPGSYPGKLVFTLRLGRGKKLAKAPLILDAIKCYAPNSLLMIDPMHGNTYLTKGGKKTRAVSHIIAETRAIGEAAKTKELRLHGIHVEATGRFITRECVSVKGEEPRGENADVDPQLNNAELKLVLEAFRESINRRDG